MSFKYAATKESPGKWVLPKTKEMKVDAIAFLSDELFESSEEEMWRQLSDAASYEGVTAAYAMPDCHAGFGVPVGCVVVTDDVVIQAASGYDISCGVIYMKANLNAKSVRGFKRREDWVHEVEKRVATGIGHHRPELMPDFSEKKAEAVLRYGAKSLGVSADLCERQYIPIPEDIDLDLVEKARAKVAPQLGSVGGGNHFVEMQVDEKTGEVFVMVHCGSRGYGYQIANHFFYEGAKLRGLPPNRREQSWLRMDEELGKQYWAYHNSAANFAVANRHVIVNGVREALQEVFGVDCEVYYEISHNLVQQETLVLPDGTSKKGFVHRKGATRAFPAGHPDLKDTVWEKTGHPCLIPGCLAEGTRVLMANGFYRGIEDIVVGDKVINGSGIPARVKAVFDRGPKPTIQYRSNQFWSSTRVTPDHKHLIADLSGYNWRHCGRMEALTHNNRDGSSKIRWSSISEAPNDFTMLLPRQISVHGVEGDLNINGRMMRPTYDLGYVFGFFLGDGSSWHELLRCGQVNMYLGKDQLGESRKLSGFLKSLFGKVSVYDKKNMIHLAVHDIEIAQFFGKFGKHGQKRLPEELFSADLSYLRGLYDGMVDSDGHHHAGSDKFTNTSSDCIELFSVIHHLLFGYFPSVSVRPPSAGGLVGCDIDNCSPSYRCTGLKRPYLTSTHQLVLPIGLVPTRRGKFSGDFSRDLETEVVRTYDISLDGDDPSFIANNAIVHNSMYHGAAVLFAQPGSHVSACSVNHGSGRIMARGAAKRKLAHKQLFIDEEMRRVKRRFADEVEIEGIVTNTKHVTLDECGHVYKDLDTVLDTLQMAGIAKVDRRLWPVANIKGTD